MRGGKGWCLVLMAVAAAVWMVSVPEVAGTPLPPFTYAGTIRSYSLRAFDAADAIEIRALNAEGLVLADCNVAAMDDGRNFQLTVPLVSPGGTESVAAATVGETLVCQILQNGRVVATDQPFATLPPVGAASGEVQVTLTLILDANANGIPDDYEEEKSAQTYDVTGQLTFDPAEDYDQDGLSNGTEFLAGSDPFSRDNAFRFRVEDSADSAVSCVAVFTGRCFRTYALQVADGLTGRPVVWETVPFRIQPDGPEVTAHTVRDADTLLQLYFTPPFLGEFVAYRIQLGWGP